MRTIARQPVGHPLLLVLGAGFACYSLWQLSVAAFGHAVRAGSDRPGKRIVSLMRGLVYGLFCASAVGLAIGSRGQGQERSKGGGLDRKGDVAPLWKGDRGASPAWW